METWELTDYEQAREAQEICIDPKQTVPSKSLYREITCPICKDVLSQTRAAPDCLHRFCSKCVDEAIKRKNCPILTCHKKLPSNLRSFKKDPKFDQLISIIFSGENLQNNDQLTLPTSNHLQQELLSRDGGGIYRAPEYEIILKPLDNLQQTRYLKCPQSTTVDHLAKYLSIRPDILKTNMNNSTISNGNGHGGKSNGSLNSSDQYKLCILANRCQAHYEPLQGTLKIEDLQSTYNLLPDKPLEIYFYAPN